MKNTISAKPNVRNSWTLKPSPDNKTRWLVTNWYMKLIFLRLMINFKSNFSCYQKISTAKSFINTVIDNSHQQFSFL